MSPPSQALPRFALFEDNLSDPPRARLLTGVVEKIRLTSRRNVSAAFSRIEALQNAGYWVAIAANYELGQALEAKLAHRADGAEVLLRAWAFERMEVLEGEALEQWWQGQLSFLSPQQREAGLFGLAPETSFDAYSAKVERILGYIRAGDCYQVNLTFPLFGQSYGHPLALFKRLRETQPVRYSAYIADDDGSILSRSPELFVERRGGRLVCKPMKGTAPRITDEIGDRAVAQALLDSDKNRAENLMIVDLIRNDLGRLAPSGGVRVDRLFELETYRSVHQLTSTIVAEPVAAELRKTFDALFPCGSITGAPKIRAMEIINELEDHQRGLYCGALGWSAPNGDSTFNVPIRTLHVTTDGSVRLDVGGGIVADSNATDEWEECFNKARFATALSDELQLIETMRFEPTAGDIPLLDLHIARLASSAMALNFTFDRKKLESAVGAYIQQLSGASQRVRLALSHDGSVHIEHAPLGVPPSSVSVRIANDKLDPNDRRLRHKTTARRFYDEALSSAIADGHFDVLFVNVRDELCEGARSNLFLEKNGVLRTPAAHCGLLPGVLRQSLLAEGKAVESVLRQCDVDDADSVWIGNALRGLLRVDRIVR